MIAILRALCLAVILAAALAPAAAAHPGHPEHDPPPLLRDVRVDQRLGGVVPTNLGFRDEQDRPVTLAQLIEPGKPVMLTMNYFRCPQLCPLLIKGVSTSLQAVKFDLGRDFTAITVSVDPRDTAKDTHKAELQGTQGYKRAGAKEGWHFLRGDAATIGQLANALGFRYKYDAKLGQYAHPPMISFLTPGARITRYLFGIDFDPRDVQLALQEASDNKIGSIADQVIYSCYQFDPEIGKYSPFALGVVRIGGVLTVALMGSYIAFSLVRERRRGGGLKAGGVG